MVNVPVVTVLAIDEPRRTAAQMTEQRERDLDEVVAGTRLVEQRPEQDEQEHHRRGHAECDAEHAFGLHPVMPQRLAERRPLPLDDLRNEIPVAKEGVHHEHGGNDHQRQAERPVCRGQDHNEADDRHHLVRGDRNARTVGDTVTCKDQIQTRRHAGETQHPVIPGDVIARTRLEQRERRRREEHGERQMNGAALIGIQCEVDARQLGEQEREIRGVVDLEERPQQGDPCDHLALPVCWITCAGIYLGDHLGRSIHVRRRRGSLAFVGHQTPSQPQTG